MKCIDEDFRKKLDQYLQEEPDETLRHEIVTLSKNIQLSDELHNRIDKFLHFGTAGLRAPMRAGYNAINRVTVYRFAYALAEVVKTHVESSVVIGFDGRLHSQEFAEEVAETLSYLAISSHVFSKSVPTPICAFATKHLSASYGVMITASHNPGQDNGIKVYTTSSAQLQGEILALIERKMAEAPPRDKFERNHNQRAAIKAISSEVIDAYFHEIKQTSLSDEAIIDVPIVYTPLHGVGRDFCLRALHERGSTQVHVVPEQSEPDGRFPTVPFPNPEEEHTLDYAHRLADKLNCSWVFANDPDADRLQVSYRLSDGTFRKLSGNEMGVILGYFCLEKARLKGQKPLVASSIVSSRMLEKIATDMGACYTDGLTGFSNIIAMAEKKEAQSGCPFVFAYEEAIGFLIGKVVLDKDGINAAARFMEVTSFLQKQNLSIDQFLDGLYGRFGLFLNEQWSHRFVGINAVYDMAQFMKNIRKLSHSDMAHHLGEKDCQKHDLLQPQSEGAYQGMLANVVIFEIKNALRLIVRPSGTEPKVKFYLEVMDTSCDGSLIHDKKSLLHIKIRNYRSSIEQILA